jgi:RNA polymerase sigma factor (sigma-70 family)
MSVLFGAAARGDERAWSALVGRFDATIRAIAARHRLDRDDRDEVAQRTWLKLVLHVERVANPDALAGWLATTARRHALDVIAERSREVAVAEPRDAGAHDHLSVEDQAIARERRDALHSAVQRVPSHERGLVRLLLDEPALSYDELSVALDMPRGSIGPTRARCLARLRGDRHLAGVAGPGSARLPLAA